MPKTEGTSTNLLESVKALLAMDASPRTTLEAVGDLLVRTFQLNLVVLQSSLHGRVVSMGEPAKGDIDSELSVGLTLESDQLLYHGAPIRLPLVANDVSRARLPADLSVELSVRGVLSFLVAGIGRHGNMRGWLECYRHAGFRRWRQEDVTLIEQVCEYISLFFDRGVVDEGVSYLNGSPDAADYQRLAKCGNIVVLQTDHEFVITGAVGSVESLLGVSSVQLLHNRGIWETLIDPRDRASLRRKIARMRLERAELQAEIRIIHQNTGAVRWMMLRALPRFSKHGDFKGWEGFGIDVTDRRQAQEEITSQHERLEALFAVARAVQGHSDPAFVALLGLKAVIRATNSACGYAAFTNRSSGALQLVAAHGLSARYLDGINEFLKGSSLVRESIEERQGILIDNLQEHPRAASELARLEGLKSTIVMPLVTDTDTFGAIVTFKREARKYSELDYDLLGAAAGQIASAVRQAEMFEAEKRHSKAVEALYRISRELSKHRTPKEIANHAFPILQEEFGLRRMWFGVLNEQGTHIVGKAGVGPGMRRQLQEVQIELNLRHDFLDEAIRTQKPVTVKPGQEMECSGLNRILQRLGPETFIIIPLVSLSQVVGILVLEPEFPATFFIQSRLQLVGSMANEMATVLMARRFESKMAEAGKMRMAGLLASGVAHNFNNLLQAVLGQVALIEMQVAKGSPALEHTKTITEAAQKGASLVSQLLNFSLPSAGLRQPLSINSMLRGSQELYRSLIGRNIELEFALPSEDFEILGDQSQIQQVITNLLVNSKDAIAGQSSGQVSLSTRRVVLSSGEIDPELPPGEYVRIDVSDNGQGMDSEQQLRCFEPFFTTKNVDRSTGVGISGSGLGLSSAYSIIRQHDGVITVFSQHEQGTLFSVYLPLMSAKAVAPIRSQQADQKTGYADGVLVLGLEPGVLPFASSVFSSLGCSSRSVFDGQQLLDILKREKEKWTTAALDFDRLGDESLPIVHAIREISPNAGVLGLTASPKEWSEKLGDTPRVQILEKPLGVWSVDAAFAALRSSNAGQKVEAVSNSDADQPIPVVAGSK